MLEELLMQEMQEQGIVEKKQKRRYIRMKKQSHINLGFFHLMIKSGDEVFLNFR